MRLSFVKMHGLGNDFAILDGRDGDKMEFQVDSGENDYKLFCPEEFHKIRRLDCGGGGK